MLFEIVTSSGHKVLMMSFCFQFLGNAQITECSVKRIVSSATTLAIMADIATNVTIPVLFLVGTASTGQQAHKCRSSVSQHTVVAQKLLVGWTDTTLQWRKVLSVGKSVFTGKVFAVGQTPILLWGTALGSMSISFTPHDTVIIATVEVKGTVSKWTSRRLRRHSRAIVVLMVTLFWQQKMAARCWNGYMIQFWNCAEILIWTGSFEWYRYFLPKNQSCKLQKLESRLLRPWILFPYKSLKSEIALTLKLLLLWHSNCRKLLIWGYSVTWCKLFVLFMFVYDKK